MQNLNEIHDFVRDTLNRYYHKLWEIGYHGNEIYFILLALYTVKSKKDSQQDIIKKELSDCIANTLTFFDFDPSDPFGPGIHPSHYFDEVCKDLRSINYDDFLGVYTSIVDEFVDQLMIVYNEYGKINQPRSIISLVDELVRLKNVSSAYHPFANIAIVPIAIKSIPFYSQEVNKELHAVGQVLLDAHGYDTRNFAAQSALKSWNPTNADCVISMPLFSASLLPHKDEMIPYHRQESIVVNNFSNGAEKYAYCLVSNAFCYEGKSFVANLRRDIIERNYLDMVISLPAGIVNNTGIATSLIVLSKNRGNNTSVRFIDARKKYFFKNKKEKELDVQSILKLVQNHEQDDCALIQAEKIRDYDYIWDAGLYVTRKNEVFPEGYQVVEFHEIAEPIRPNSTNNETKGHYVTIGQLSNEVANYKRTPESFDLSENINNALKLEEPALLLSRVGALKPTYCLASVENPIFVNYPNVRVFRIIAEWVNPAYLCLELTKQTNLAVGATIPHINLNQILNMRIAFPSIGTRQSYIDQGRLYNEFVSSSKLAKAREMGLQAVINKMKSEYMMEVRNRKHDMKTPMTQLRNTLTLIEAFAIRLPKESAVQLNSYISRQKVALDTLSEIVRHLADEDVFSKPEVLEIETILSSFACKNEKYSIVYVPDSIALNEVAGKEKAKVYMGKSDFLRLINNIVGNAVDHGFVEDKTDYELLISLSVEEDSYLIDFTNNGKPLPDGMDKARYGMKGVKGKDSEGQGTGGYVVKSIVEHYGGDYDVFTRDWAGRTLTDVIIKLPIYRGDE